MVDTPASVRLERGRKRATGLGRQEGGLCENPRVEDSTLESRAKKSPKLMEGLTAGQSRNKPLGRKAKARAGGSEVLADWGVKSYLSVITDEAQALCVLFLG